MSDNIQALLAGTTAFLALFVAVGIAHGQTTAPSGTWHLWSVEGSPPADAPVSRSEQRVSRSWPQPDRDSVSMRFETRLVDRRLEVFEDGTFRMTSVERDQQLIYAPDLRALGDSVPPVLAAAPGYVAISTRVDTVVRIGEWVEAGDSLVFRTSTVGAGQELTERLSMGDTALQRSLDSLFHETLEEKPVLGIGRLVRGRLFFRDKYLGQEIVLTKQRRWE